MIGMLFKKQLTYIIITSDTPFYNIRQVNNNHIYIYIYFVIYWSNLCSATCMKLYAPILICFIPIPTRIELFKENVSKIARGDNKNCFRKLKDTKVYNFDRFYPLPFKSKRKRVCSEKSVFLHLSLSVKGNGLVRKRRRSILA